MKVGSCTYGPSSMAFSVMKADLCHHWLQVGMSSLKSDLGGRLPQGLVFSRALGRLYGGSSTPVVTSEVRTSTSGVRNEVSVFTVMMACGQRRRIRVVTGVSTSSRSIQNPAGRSPYRSCISSIKFCSSSRYRGSSRDGCLSHTPSPQRAHMPLPLGKYSIGLTSRREHSQEM